MYTWMRNNNGKFIIDRSEEVKYNHDDFYVPLQFKPKQLEIIRDLYRREIAPRVRNFKYLGQGITFSWGDTHSPNVEEKFDANDTIVGLKIPGLDKDPAWTEAFSDILPYMNCNGSISIMPPYTVMVPHIDRHYRPVPIYFPISGCTNNCFSDVYDLPLEQTRKIRSYTWENVMPIISYSIVDNPVMMRNSCWHGVRNFSRQTRIAFGWNTKGDEGFKTFEELKEIFTNLGYYQTPEKIKADLAKLGIFSK